MELAVYRRALERIAGASKLQEFVSCLGFEPEAHPVNYLDETTSEVHERVSPVADGLFRVGEYKLRGGTLGFWTANLRQWGERTGDRERARRRITKALVELQPAHDRRFLLALMAADVEDIEFILPRVREDKSLGTVRAVIDCKEPTRHHLQLLQDLTVSAGESSLIVFRHWNQAFNVENVAKRFYVEFRDLRNRVLAELKRHNKKIQRIQDPANEDEVRRYVTRNLGRILFLWFLQSKGWLDGDHKYLVNLYEQRCRNNANHVFFAHTLVPLFFEALARKKAQRGEAAKALGDVPFLNGGLFLQSRFEDLLYGEERQHVEIMFPNTLFDPRCHSSDAPTVLGLLNSYRFTTRESTPDDQSVDPDPELLGKVFENLNEESERAETGTFYTPREVVQFMCRAALDSYLLEKANVEEDTLGWLRQEATDPEASDRRMSAKERTKIEEVLDSVTVCDPAVGSGAFPVGMLQELLLLKRGLRQSADVTVDVGGQTVAEWKEHIISNCLYGVDINPEAVEICHLRLWLSLVIDANEPVPLPNLDFRFVAGDSLVDRIGNLALRESLPRQPIAGKLGLGVLEQLPQLETQISQLRTGFAHTDTPSKARTLRERIKRLQIKAVKLQVQALSEGLDATAKTINKKITTLEAHGAGQRELKRLKKQLEDYENELTLLEELMASLDPWAPYKKPLLWPVEFPEVFEKGGFDIVVANPPYVRQESLSADDQVAYQASYPEVFKGTADLLVFFIARAIQICRDKGHLSFITSNKYMRASYGTKTRAYLPTVLTYKYLVDFGDLPVFDAAAYPAIMVASNHNDGNDIALLTLDLAPIVRKQIQDQKQPLNVAAVRDALADLSSELIVSKAVEFRQADLGTEPWVLEDSQTLEVLARVEANGTALSDCQQYQVYRGVTTGLNEAFVISNSARKELVAGDGKSRKLIKSWFRGKDIRRWQVKAPGLHLIFTQHGTTIADFPAVKRHLSKWRRDLEPRKPGAPAGSPGRKPGPYRWFEIQDSTAYASEFVEPKIVWAKTSKDLAFAWDDSGSYCANTVHIIVDAPQWLLGVLNSKVSTFTCFAKVNLLRGGYIELTPTRIGALRIPKDQAKAEKLLGPIVRSISEALEAGADIAPLEEELNRRVATLFELSVADMAFIDSWLTGKRA